MGTVASPGFKLGKPGLNFIPRILTAEHTPWGALAIVGTESRGAPDAVANWE